MIGVLVMEFVWHAEAWMCCPSPVAGSNNQYSCGAAESLLYQLESYGPEAFAAALVGDSDTPELIWTHRMRGQRLVPQVRALVKH